MTSDESKLFIEKSLESSESRQLLEVQKLGEKLGGFPSALHQLVATFNQPHTSTGEYFSQLNSVQEQMKKYELVMQGSQNIIEEQELGAAAIKILNIMSYLHPRNIPTNIFKELDKTDFVQPLKLLKKYSIIEMSKDESYSNIPRVVQDIIRLKQTPSEAKNNLMDAMRITLHSDVEEVNIDHYIIVWMNVFKIDKRENQDQTATSMADSFQDSFEIIIRFLIEDERYKDAEEFGKKACEYLEKWYNLADEFILNTKTWLANVYVKLKMYDDAATNWIDIYIEILRSLVKGWM